MKAEVRGTQGDGTVPGATAQVGRANVGTAALGTSSVPWGGARANPLLLCSGPSGMAPKGSSPLEGVEMHENKNAKSKTILVYLLLFWGKGTSLSLVGLWLASWRR